VSMHVVETSAAGYTANYCAALYSRDRHGNGSMAQDANM
jgi:hypothetical protein